MKIVYSHDDSASICMKWRLTEWFNKQESPHFNAVEHDFFLYIRFQGNILLKDSIHAYITVAEICTILCGKAHWLKAQDVSAASGSQNLQGPC